MTKDLNIRIVRAHRYCGNTQWNYQGVLYPYNTLYFVIDGNGHIKYNGTTTDMKPGYAYLIPQRLRHDVWCDTHVEKVYVDVHVELLPGYDVFIEKKEILSQPLGIERCKRLYDICEGGIRDRLEFRGELALILAGFMAKEPQPASAKMVVLLPLITEMQQNLSAQIRREELAALYGWNPSVLSRTFKQVFGCGIKQYAEKLLSTRLAEELLLSDKTLRHLADEYGFCDAYYLSAFFKRSMGVSPTAYRRTHWQQVNNEK